MRTSPRIVRVLFLLSLLCGLAAPGAHAQEAPPPASSGLGFGLKAGFGLEPDQFVVGAQFSLGQPISIFRVVPNIDIGFGHTTIDFNVDFLVRLLDENTAVALYGGGAPTVAYVNKSGAGDEWTFGFSLVAGIQVPPHRQQYGLALRASVRFQRDSNLVGGQADRSLPRHHDGNRDLRLPFQTRFEP